MILHQQDRDGIVNRRQIEGPDAILTHEFQRRPQAIQRRLPVPATASSVVGGIIGGRGGVRK